jgi:hypothetical protein
MSNNLKENLDIRICDLKEEVYNTQTFREYIKETEEYFGWSNADIDNMNKTQFELYLRILDTMWLIGK